MTFGDPRWLWGLLALPVLLLLEWSAVVRSDRMLRELVGARTDSVLLEQRRAGQRRLSMALRLLALTLLVVGAADPQWGRELVRRGASGSDVVLAIDVSASMDTRDVAPSRLEEARREALAVLDRLEGSRVGLVAFAGDAVRLCPLTLDLGAVRLSLEGLGSGAVSEPGTDLGKALRTAARVLARRAARGTGGGAVDGRRGSRARRLVRHRRSGARRHPRVHGGRRHTGRRFRADAGRSGARGGREARRERADGTQPPG